MYIIFFGGGGNEESQYCTGCMFCSFVAETNILILKCQFSCLGGGGSVVSIISELASCCFSFIATPI